MRIELSDGSFLRAPTGEDFTFYTECMQGFELPGVLESVRENFMKSEWKDMLHNYERVSYPLKEGDAFVLCLIFCQSDGSPTGLRMLGCNGKDMFNNRDLIHPNFRGQGNVTKMRRAWMYVTWDILQGDTLTWKVRQPNNAPEVSLRYNYQVGARDVGATGMDTIEHTMTREMHDQYIGTNAASFDREVTFLLKEP